jgi:hypothetical protein
LGLIPFVFGGVEAGGSPVSEALHMDIQPLRMRFFDLLVIGFLFGEIACLDHLGCRGEGNGGTERKMGMKEHDKRFGVTAVEKGFITLEQLFDAMKIQLTEEIEKREHRLLGTILFDMGVLSPPQIDEVLHSMGTTIRT